MRSGSEIVDDVREEQRQAASVIVQLVDERFLDAGIRHAVLQILGDFDFRERIEHDCFAQSLQRDAPVTGVVLVIELDVGANGKVPWVSVGRSHSRLLGDCVSAAIRSWTVKAKPARYTFQIEMKTA